MSTFAAAMYAVTMWMLTIAAQRRFSYALYGGAGAVFAFCIHTNFLFLMFVPAMIAHVILLVRQTGEKQDFRVAAVSVVGGTLAATIALGLFALTHGHDFNFMWPQIHYVLDYLHPEKQTWYRSWASGWWYGSNSGGWGSNTDPYFASFLIAAIGSVFVLIAASKTTSAEDSRNVARISIAIHYLYAFSALRRSSNGRTGALTTLYNDDSARGAVCNGARGGSVLCDTAGPIAETGISRHDVGDNRSALVLAFNVSDPKSER